MNTPKVKVVNADDPVWMFVEYGVWTPNRMLYLGSRSAEEDAGGHVGSQSETGVGFEMVRYFLPALLMLDAQKNEPIIIYMNTPGGDWHHGIAIYDAIVNCKNEVTIVAFGYARSMSSIILQAADNRILMPHTHVMIHDGEEWWRGTPRSGDEWQKESKRIRDDMYDIYVDRAAAAGKNLLKSQVKKWCSKDTIFTADEAVGHGLADKIWDGKL